VTGPASIEVVVPARNEARRLPEGLAALCEKAASLPMPASILVVDSASTDSTADIVRAWPQGPVPVRLLQCTRPGKGVAVRAGLLATQAPYVGFCDADMATDLSAVDTAVKLLTAGHQVVVGSRGLKESVLEVPPTTGRQLGAVVFRAIARTAVPGTTDTQCGFKFFAGPLARAAALPLRTPGWAFDVELLSNCLRLGATVTEIPVHWRDVTGSNFQPRRQAAGTFRDGALICLRARVLRRPVVTLDLADRDLRIGGVTTT
jgi:dolichyl-phosphate beta-glucosyltransferase